jgi:hypothetical protein
MNTLLNVRININSIVMFVVNHYCSNPLDLHITKNFQLLVVRVLTAYTILKSLIPFSTTHSSYVMVYVLLV